MKNRHAQCITHIRNNRKISYKFSMGKIKEFRIASILIGAVEVIGMLTDWAPRPNFPVKP